MGEQARITEGQSNSELARVVAKFIDDLSLVPTEIADEMGEHSLLADALEQVAARFCDFADPSSISCQVAFRQVRDIDKVAIKDGDDPGIYLVMVNGNGETAQINIYGGLRLVESTLDLKDSRTSVFFGHGHADRTNSIISTPTQLGVDLYDKDGVRIVNIWFQLTGEGIAPDHQGIAITLMNYSDSSVDLHITHPLHYPKDFFPGIAKPLRDGIRALQQIRGSNL